MTDRPSRSDSDAHPAPQVHARGRDSRAPTGPTPGAVGGDDRPPGVRGVLVRRPQPWPDRGADGEPPRPLRRLPRGTPGPLRSGRRWTRTRGGSSATGTSSSPTRSTAPSPARSSWPATRARARPSRTTSPSPGSASRTSGRWNMATRIQFASKLLSSAHGAGLIVSNRDPRPLAVPPGRANRHSPTSCTSSGACSFEGTLLENPYLASVGLQGGHLEDRLRGLSVAPVSVARETSWTSAGRFGGLEEWASSLSLPPRARAGGMR